jgi:hypothetical protein
MIDDIQEPEPGVQSLGSSGYLYVPDFLARLVRCKVCGDDYLNSEYLDAHVNRDHGKEASSANRL